MKYWVSRASRSLWFWMVAMPVSLSAIYFALLASPIYVTESQFLINQNQQGITSLNQSSISSLLSNAGVATSGISSAYSISGFLTSRPSLLAVNQKLNVQQHYSDPRLDFISRFGPFAWDHSFESFYKYSFRYISADVDSTSGVVTLTVRAFSPQMALQINQQYLEQAEVMLNKINQRMVQDTLTSAELFLQGAEKRADLSAHTLADYRAKHGVIDPEVQAHTDLTNVAQLRAQLITVQAQRHVLERQAPASPQLESLIANEKSLLGALASETSRISGASPSLAGQAGDIATTLLQSNTNAQLLAGAITLVNNAESNTLQKTMYLSRTVVPVLPDVPQEPKRLWNVLVIGVFSLIIYALTRMLIAGVREHSA